MRAKWLEVLSKKVEDRYGSKIRDRIFGDIPRLPINYDANKEWLHCLVRGINDLNDVDFTKKVLANIHHIVQDKAQIHVVTDKIFNKT